ncbi:MAG: hypothetical protein K6E63_11375 [Lachnospiraceae bacterium]|nr:hypothetical protein [Lachnospiraceae bacterium]
MINKKRLIAATAATAVILAMLTACGGGATAAAPAQVNETAQEAVTEEVKEPEETEEAAEAVDEEDGMGDSFDEEEESGAASDADQYIQAYLEEAKTLLDAGDADQFAFVNLDGDDIPELVASSSEGSWDKDQVFIYGINNGVAVLLVSDIAPGMEGHSLGFFEGENIIEVSGSAMGERYEYYSVRDGELDQVFTLENYDDPEKDYETVYFVDGEEADEAAYAKAEKEFLASHGKLTRLETENMSVVSIDCSQGYRDVKVDSTVPYKSYNDLK